MAKSLSDMIDNTILSMVMKQLSTLAQAITRVGIEIVNKPNIKAAAFTNGKAIYLNEPIIDEMNKKKTETVNGKTYHYEINEKVLTFIICHELMHLLNETEERGNRIGVLKDDHSEEGMMKHELWNLATDFEINYLLHNNKSDGQSRPIGEKPDWCCYDDKYKDKPAEEIYLELYKKAKQNGKNENGKWSFSAGGMQYTVGNGQGDNNQDNDNQNQNGNSNSNSSQGDEDENQKGNNQSNDKGGQDNEDEQKPNNGLSYGLDVHMPFVDELTKSEVKAKLSDALRNGGKEAGSGMSAFDRMLEIAFAPQPFNWRRALTRYIKSFMKENYTWNKPSRAGIANRLILPSTSTTPKLHVGVAVDTSGSIGDTELNLLMNHVFTILSQFRQFTVDLWCCSTHVHENTFRTYTAANKNTLCEFKIESDGGTNMSKNLEFVKKHYNSGNTPDLLMIFTDGYDDLSGDEETRTQYPVVWLIVDNKNFVKPKYMPGAVYEFNTD